MVISFHSLEDRMVKDAMRDGARQGAVRAVDQEAGSCRRGRSAENPRSRSAKLRAAARK